MCTGENRERSRSKDRNGRRSAFRAVIRRIPAGRVATYGQVAELAGFPGHARQVGYALFALPERSPVPWHRVVNARGRLSLGMVVPEGDMEQRIRLEIEGVEFDADGRIDLNRFRWRPRRCAPAKKGLTPVRPGPKAISRSSRVKST